MNLLHFLFFSNSEGGAVYIPWGRKSCPEGTQLVYTGIKYMIDVFIINHTHTHTHKHIRREKQSLCIIYSLSIIIFPQ